MVTCIADIYFAPTKLSANNLIKEGDVNIILNYRNTAINKMNTIVDQSYRREVLACVDDNCDRVKLIDLLEVLDFHNFPNK